MVATHIGSWIDCFTPKAIANINCMVVDLQRDERNLKLMHLRLIGQGDRHKVLKTMLSFWWRTTPRSYAITCAQVSQSHSTQVGISALPQSNHPTQPTGASTPNDCIQNPSHSHRPIVKSSTCHEPARRTTRKQAAGFVVRTTQSLCVSTLDRI